MQGNILLVDDACREEVKNALPGTLLKRRWPPTEFALGRRNRSPSIWTMRFTRSQASSVGLEVVELAQSFLRAVNRADCIELCSEPQLHVGCAVK